MNDITTPKKSLIVAMASRYAMEPAAFQATVKATVMPQNASNEQLAAFLLVAHEYGLNPITREIHAFPSRGGGVTPVVGIDGWISLAQRRPEFDGMEFDYTPDAVTCRIYRKDRSRPVEVTEFMDECKRATDPWKSHPRRMLRHKATIQAIRYAFGFSGIKDEDDAEVIYATEKNVTPATSDLNAALEQQTNDKQHQWPEKIGDGKWRDSRGVPFSREVHSWSGHEPSVTAEGQFRKRRGCDPKAHHEYEQLALHGPQTSPEDEATQPSTQAQETPENTAQKPSGGPGYPEIMQAIQRIQTSDDYDNAADLVRSFDGPDDQRAELVSALENQFANMG